MSPRPVPALTVGPVTDSGHCWRHRDGRTGFSRAAQLPRVPRGSVRESSRSAASSRGNAQGRRRQDGRTDVGADQGGNWM